MFLKKEYIYGISCEVPCAQGAAIIMCTVRRFKEFWEVWSASESEVASASEVWSASESEVASASEVGSAPESEVASALEVGSASESEVGSASSEDWLESGSY